MAGGRHDSHTDPLACGIRPFEMGHAKWESLKLLAKTVHRQMSVMTK